MGFLKRKPTQQHTKKKQKDLRRRCSQILFWWCFRHRDTACFVECWCMWNWPCRQTRGAHSRGPFESNNGHTAGSVRKARKSVLLQNLFLTPLSHKYKHCLSFCALMHRSLLFCYVYKKNVLITSKKTLFRLFDSRFDWKFFTALLMLKLKLQFWFSCPFSGDGCMSLCDFLRCSVCWCTNNCSNILWRYFQHFMKILCK